MAFDVESLHDFKNRTWIKDRQQVLRGKWPKGGGYPACIPLQDEDGNPLLDSQGNVICQAGTGYPPQTHAPALIFAPTISGIPTSGQTLMASTGVWSQNPVAYAYQWTRNLVSVAGATASAYLLGPADVGQTIDVMVYAVNNVAYSSPAFARSIGPIPSPLTISGTPVTTATHGVAYAGFTARSLGGWAPYAFNLIAGFWPDGIAMNATTGAVAGVPTTVGRSPRLVIQVTDRYGQTANLPPFGITVS